MSEDQNKEIEEFKIIIEKTLKDLGLSDELVEKRTNEIVQNLIKDMEGAENI